MGDVTRVIQIMPCEPGWRVLNVVKIDPRGYRAYPVIGWALVCDQENGREYTRISPAYLSHEAVTTAPVSVLPPDECDMPQYVGTLAPGDEPTFEVWRKRIAEQTKIVDQWVEELTQSVSGRIAGEAAS